MNQESEEWFVVTTTENDYGCFAVGSFFLALMILFSAFQIEPDLFGVFVGLLVGSPFWVFGIRFSRSWYRMWNQRRSYQRGGWATRQSYDDIMAAQRKSVGTQKHRTPRRVRAPLRRRTTRYSNSSTPKHRTSRGEIVRSKAEVIVANTLARLGIQYEYEKRLYNPTNPRDSRLPDFTILHNGQTFYWEHLGMLSNPKYKRDWEAKKRWYTVCGFGHQLITSRDYPDGSIDSFEIEQIARNRILGSMTSKGGPQLE